MLLEVLGPDARRGPRLTPILEAGPFPRIALETIPRRRRAERIAHLNAFQRSARLRVEYADDARWRSASGGRRFRDEHRRPRHDQQTEYDAAHSARITDMGFVREARTAGIRLAAIATTRTTPAPRP